MSSKVDICNIALANIHASSINSLTEASIEAQYCKLYFDTTLKTLLRLHNWSFARKQDALALSTDKLFEWVYAYQYPSDCIRINTLISQIEKMTTSYTNGLSYRQYYPYDTQQMYRQSIDRYKVDYDVITVGGNRLIGANEPDLLIDYQYFVDDPNKWDSLFTQSFTWLLASEIAPAIIGGDTSRVMRKDALNMYNNYIGEAMAKDANESHSPQLASEITIARL